MSVELSDEQVGPIKSGLRWYPSGEVMGMDETQQKPTCGPLYLDALTQYTGGDAEKIRLFAAGFVHGQAEKVYLGACPAAMFRPPPERWQMVFDLATDAAQRYGLRVITLESVQEIWLCRDNTAAAGVEGLDRMELNSAEWHLWRGNLCGVPDREIDLRFHERSGYGEICDQSVARLVDRG